MSVLKANGLKKYYGSGNTIVKAVDGIDLEIGQGSFTAIVGSSGSGKTTLLKMLGGLLTPTEGSVEVNGVDISKMTDEELTIFRRRKVGFVFQNYNLIPNLNVYENIVFPLDLDRVVIDEEYIGKIIAMLKLETRLSDYPEQLSGGQQQRVAIARALAAKPSILLADEPTGNLDSKMGQEVMGLFKMTSSIFGQTLVMITHNEEIAQLADRVIRIEDGKIVHQGEQKNAEEQ